MSSKPTIKSITIIKDNRGWFAPLLKSFDLDNDKFGQVSLTVIKSSKTKGNHYHKVKYEWFVVILGEVKFELQNLDTKEKMNITLGESKLKILCVPPMWHHTLFNMSNKDAVIMIYYHPPFDPRQNDEHNDIYVDKAI